MLPQAKTRLCDAEWLNCVSPNTLKKHLAAAGTAGIRIRDRVTRVV